MFHSSGPRAGAEKLVRDEELMRLLLAGYRLKEIAAMHQLNYQTLLRAARRPTFLEELRALNGEIYGQLDQEIRGAKALIKDRAEELASLALDRLELLLDSGDERVAMQAVTRALDMNTNTAKVTKSESENKHSFINPLQLTSAFKAAEEMDRASASKTVEGETIQ